MSPQNKRHYRVAKNTRVEDDHTMQFTDECMTRFTVTAIIVYTVSIVISMCLGYLIGKEQ